MYLPLALVLCAAVDPLQNVLELEKQGRDADALVAAERLIRDQPGSQLARLEAGRLRLKSGERLDLAQLHLDVARSLAPENPRAHFLYGQLMEEQRQPEAAERAYEVALSLRDDFDEARLRLAGLQMSAKQFAAAAESYRRYVGAHPEATGPRLQLASALEQVGNVVDAERELKAMRGDAKTKELATRKLADFYDRHGKHKEAAKLRLEVDGPGRKLRPLKPSGR